MVIETENAMENQNLREITLWSLVNVQTLVKVVVKIVLWSYLA